MTEQNATTFTQDANDHIQHDHVSRTADKLPYRRYIIPPLPTSPPHWNIYPELS